MLHTNVQNIKHLRTNVSPKKKENSLANQSKCYGFQLRFNCKVLSGENDQLIINTMVYTVNGIKVRLARELMSYNRSVE